MRSSRTVTHSDGPWRDRRYSEGVSTILLAVLLNLVVGQTPSSPTFWGGDHVDLEVGASSATIEFDCAHGTFDEGLRIDKTGAFVVKGSFTPERSGPSRDDNGPRALKATYSGTIAKDAMTLRVVVDGQDPKGTTYQLTRGQRGNLRKCR